MEKSLCGSDGGRGWGSAVSSMCKSPEAKAADSSMQFSGEDCQEKHWPGRSSNPMHRLNYIRVPPGPTGMHTPSGLRALNSGSSYTPAAESHISTNVSYFAREHSEW
jgi:hypothetical protein